MFFFQSSVLKSRWLVKSDCIPSVGEGRYHIPLALNGVKYEQKVIKKETNGKNNLTVHQQPLGIYFI